MGHLKPVSVSNGERCTVHSLCFVLLRPYFYIIETQNERIQLNMSKQNERRAHTIKLHQNKFLSHKQLPMNVKREKVNSIEWKTKWSSKRFFFHCAVADRETLWTSKWITNANTSYMCIKWMLRPCAALKRRRSSNMFLLFFFYFVFFVFIVFVRRYSVCVCVRARFSWGLLKVSYRMFGHKTISCSTACFRVTTFLPNSLVHFAHFIEFFVAS